MQFILVLIGRCWLVALLSVFLASQCAGAERPIMVPKWDGFEAEFKSRRSYENPLNDVSLVVVFTSPSGQSRMAPAFWDGGKVFRARFSPNEVGRWIYTTVCSDKENKGLENQNGSFTCTAATGRNRFSQHGPVLVSRDGRFLLHEDGTPFFWMGDTAWNGALLATQQEWYHYIDTRLRQRFSAVQWVTTQWRASPEGNRLGQLAFTGEERIQVNPVFFRELDRKVEALNDAGILNVPVLLWAIGGGSNPRVNPGFSLPEDQAILLARYMVARWGGNDVAWILGGDGDYRGRNSEKWVRIGRGVFGDLAHAPVIMHPGGMHWILPEFLQERWLDIHGYQSGHGDDDKTLSWIVSGPPSVDWRKEPYRPFINLEPPYENHIAYQSKTRITPEQVRRAVYWSLLVSPTAGVTYGGHGVWGWDDGSKPPTDHPSTGIPSHWREALSMPGAQQMAHVVSLFNSVNFWRLRPAQQALARQPGVDSPKKFITVARTVEGDQLVAYTPAGGTVALLATNLPRNLEPSWFDPQSGKRQPALPKAVGNALEFTAPTEADWLLVVKSR